MDIMHKYELLHEVSMISLRKYAQEDVDSMVQYITCKPTDEEVLTIIKDQKHRVRRSKISL